MEIMYWIVVIVCMICVYIIYSGKKDKGLTLGTMLTEKPYSIAFIGVIVSVLLLLVLCALTSSNFSSPSYEDNLDSGMDKFTNGDYDSATDEEKDAVDDFLDWQSEQD